MTTHAEARRLAKEINDDAAKVENMTLEEIIAAKEKINSLRLNRDLIKAKDVACISIVNIQEIFVRRLITTAMLGFQSRIIDNYVPKEEVKVVQDSYDQLVESAEEEAEKSRLRTECAAKIKALTLSTKKILQQFHKSTYQFNPDVHIQKTILESAVAKPAEILTRCGIDYYPVPLEHYHNLDRYITSHYDDLVAITEAYYAEKSDYANLFIYYGSFPNEERAKEWVSMHEDELHYEVATVSPGMTNITPTRINREKTSFANRETDILHQIQEQAKQDYKIGTDLMRKRVKDTKRDNVEKFGADIEELEEYMSVTDTIGQLGGKRAMTREEQIKLKEARDKREALETPVGAIQVDILSTTQDENGDQVLTRKKIYTQAEAPLHMQEDSNYTGEFQPIRADGVSVDETLTRDDKGNVSLVDDPDKFV